MAGDENTYLPSDYQDVETLRDRIRSVVDHAKSILDKVADENRDPTDDERRQIDEALLQAGGLEQIMNRKNGTKSGTAARNAEFAQLGRELTGGIGLTAPGAPGSKAMTGRNWAGAILSKSGGDNVRQKALTPSGAVLVDVPAPEPIALGRAATSLRQLIPVAPTDGVFSYLRQTVRTNNAAPVAPGALKPTSIYAFELITDRARVIAHLSEPIPRQDLADAESLAQFLAAEMSYGLDVALDAQVLTGNGTGENMTGLGSTSGALTVAAVTGGGNGLMQTLRRGITALEQTGVAATGWIVSPATWESIELAADSQGSYLLTDAGAAVPIDRAARRLWGLPVVSSPSCPSDIAWLGDWAGSTKIYEREQAALSWSENTWDPNALGTGVGASDFARNLMRFRVESRYGFGVLRPSGLVKLTLPTS